MTEKIVRHPALDREDQRKTALRELLEAAHDATFPGMVADSALTAAQKLLRASQDGNSTMDRQTQITRIAEHMIATYGTRALEYSRRIETSSHNREFAVAVTKEIERKSPESDRQA